MDKAPINKNLSLIESNKAAIYSIINAKCQAYRQHAYTFPVFPVDEPGA